jgi:outer membrane protein insertion porin family
MKNKLFFYLTFSILLSGCSNTKHLPEGELLYVGGSVKVKDSFVKRKERRALEKEMKGMLRPKPNSKILGLRVKLYAYNLAGETKKEKGIKHWLRNKFGEPPVVFSQVDLEYNADVLRSYAENRGYFKARTSADSTRRGKRATAEYRVRPGKQYKLRNILFPDDSTALAQEIGKTARRTALKSGQPYDLDMIKAERERIDAALKQKGFYFFSPDYLLAQADSTVGKYQVDLKFRIKEETPGRAREKYSINNITIYPNFSIRDTLDYRAENVVRYNDFTIIDTAYNFRPQIFNRTLLFRKGELYNRKDHNLTLNRLINMGPFRFVKNEFRVSDSLDYALDAFYFLTPMPKKSIRVEALGKTNSANFTGSELNVNWSHRNAFKGAELVQLSAFGGMEVQVSGINRGFNVYRIGGEANVIWPKFLTPFNVNSASGFVPRTKATLGYEYQNRRKLYSLNSFKGSFGYQWKEDIRKEHTLDVTEILYVSPTNVSELYRDQMQVNPSLAKVIERQLIFGPVYSFTFTNTMRRHRRHTFFYRGQIDLAGNIAGLVTGANIREGDTVKIFNVPFSQFAKTENDFRHYLRLGDNSQLASRIIAGVGVPYGNSNELPFIKQFFVGGTNSIRAFRARALGPGSFDPGVGPDTFLPDQSGDIKLEFNTELRGKLFSIVHGALFVDAGNIWLMNPNPLKPGAEFTGDFLKEVAVGTGFGLRFDLNFLVVRTDLAFPLRKPYLPDGQRWVLDQIDFGGKYWRRDNLVFNLAIGYPF